MSRATRPAPVELGGRLPYPLSSVAISPAVGTSRRELLVTGQKRHRWNPSVPAAAARGGHLEHSTPASDLGQSSGP